MTKNRSIAPISLGIIVPCFNEELVLGETNTRLISLMTRMKNLDVISDQSAIVYVDDGSTDQTWRLIEEFSSESPWVGGIKLSRNRGHQKALLCGLLAVPGDALISIDADLQDDLEAIPKMVHLFREGHEIVYGVRRRRDVDTFFKRISATAYYKFMLAMRVDIVFNHADFRLLGRRALDALSGYGETNLFLRGLVRLVGYKSCIVEYDRAARSSGESKYTLRKMISFAWEGVTSFSTAPLRLITIIGFSVALASTSLAVWGFFASLAPGKTLPGWASTVVPMYFLGGIQLLSLGVIGEYIAKIYHETKGRPRFHIEEVTGAFSRGVGSMNTESDAIELKLKR